MADTKIKFTVNQGSTFKKKFLCKFGGEPLDLSDCIITFKAVPSPTGSNIVYGTDTSGITISGELGVFVLVIPKEATAYYTWSTAKFDIHVEFPDGEKIPLMAGTLKLNRRV